MRQRRRLTRLWTAALGALCATTTWADNPPEGSDGTVETLLVVGSRAGISQAEMPGHVSVIDRQQIEALNRTSLNQLISAFSGVSINQQGGAGGVTSMYVRGGEANFTVILIDGVQVNNPVDTRGGSFDFATLDPAQIERIELIRGPQSAVYGADALSGVLNIVTRAPVGQQVALALEGGQDGYYRGQLHARAGTDNGLNLSLNLGRSDSGDGVAGSRRKLNFGNAALSWEASATGVLSAGVRYGDSDRVSYPEDSGGPELAVWDALDEATAEDVSAYLGWQAQATERWRYQLQANWHRLKSREDTPGIFPGNAVPPRSTDVDFDRYQLIWTNRLQLDRLRLGFGIDAEREDGSSQGLIDFGFPLDTSFSLVRDSWGGFVEANATLTDTLALSVSARYDDIDQAGSELTGRFGLLWQPADRTTLRASWGEGFKPPSFFALAHPLVGNPALAPERSESWEIGMEQLLGESWSLGLVFFDATYTDLIDFDDALFINVNRDQVDARGLELDVSADTDSLGSFRIHATWTDTNIVDVAETLRGRPEWKWGAQWFYGLREGLDLSIEYLWVDEVAEASRHTGESVDYVLDAYGTLDLSLSWSPSPALVLRAALENAFDEQYQQAVGFPAPGRFFRVGVEWRPL